MTLATLVSCAAVFVHAQDAPLPPEVQNQALKAITAQYGQAQQARADLGVKQVADRWQKADGDSDEFVAFCKENFVADPAELDSMFRRIQDAMEQIDGSVYALQAFLLRPFDLADSPPTVADYALANIELGARADDELFRSKAAFVVLLNFPLHTLADRETLAPKWTRLDWAKSRLAERFADRVPSLLLQAQTKAVVDASTYLAGINIHTCSLTDSAGKQLYADNRRLAVHWGLRDEIKALYNEPGAMPKQESVFAAMERIVRDDIPSGVIDNADAKWCPTTNQVFSPPTEGTTGSRYQHWLDVFRAERAMDAVTPMHPTFLQRRNDGYRQIEAARVERMVLSVLQAPEAKHVAQMAQSRLGRPLKPFDLWFTGFSALPNKKESELDAIVKGRYPDIESFSKDIPRILVRLGFETEKAAWLASHIVVEPASGAGHALAPLKRGEPSRLRTRFGPDGMDYKSFNIAIHELGHCVEQLFSLYTIDHWFLRSVPNEAFTEALAFLFQYRDLELLDLLQTQDPVLEFWATFGTAGSALVDIRVWEWLYAHQTADATQLRDATVRISKEVWNQYFAPLLGGTDTPVLGVYSHLVSNRLYLPDYVLGRIAAYHLSTKIKGTAFGAEFGRVAKIGNLTPSAWMTTATGGELSLEPMLAAVRARLVQGQSVSD